jgi:hypothetical protein
MEILPANGDKDWRDRTNAVACVAAFEGLAHEFDPDAAGCAEKKHLQFAVLQMSQVWQVRD